jgi:hypothetical protein
LDNIDDSFRKIRSDFNLPEFLKEPQLVDDLKSINIPEGSPTGTLIYAAPQFAEALLFLSAQAL